VPRRRGGGRHFREGLVAAPSTLLLSRYDLAGRLRFTARTAPSRESPPTASHCRVTTQFSLGGPPGPRFTETTWESCGARGPQRVGTVRLMPTRARDQHAAPHPATERKAYGSRAQPHPRPRRRGCVRTGCGLRLRRDTPVGGNAVHCARSTPASAGRALAMHARVHAKHPRVGGEGSGDARPCAREAPPRRRGGRPTPDPRPPYVMRGILADAKHHRVGGEDGWYVVSDVQTAGTPPRGRGGPIGTRLPDSPQAKHPCVGGEDGGAGGRAWPFTGTPPRRRG
jgi:hypothetical protein